MRKPLAIIKIGGSVITYKDQFPPQFRRKVIQTLVQQLIKVQKYYQIILVHGAGSFAHFYAKDYQLVTGIKDCRQIEGFSVTTASLLKLHNIILQEMHKKGLYPMGLPPHAFINKNNQLLDSIDLKLIHQFLDFGFIPVLYGDVVLDSKQGCAILSGDELVGCFAKYLDPKQVIFLSDVDGIFNDNPKTNPTAKLIKKITNKNFESILASFKPYNSADVTGEMFGKLRSIQESFSGKEVIVANGFEKNILIKILINNDDVGTKIMLG